MIKQCMVAIRVLVIGTCLLSLAGCQPGATPTPTATPKPTATATLQPEPTATSTPTPTPVPVLEVPTDTPEPSPCDGLTGTVEVRVLVGPAEVVGLEPQGVGSVPFEVTSGEAPYHVEGGGNIAYNDTLVEEDVTYDVTLNAALSLVGTCEDTGTVPQLVLELTMDWDQMIEVTARDFHGEYPVEGNPTVDVVFPLEDGATATPLETAELVLHLGE